MECRGEERRSMPFQASGNSPLPLFPRAEPFFFAPFAGVAAAAFGASQGTTRGWRSGAPFSGALYIMVYRIRHCLTLYSVNKTLVDTIYCQ